MFCMYFQVNNKYILCFFFICICLNVPLEGSTESWLGSSSKSSSPLNSHVLIKLYLIISSIKYKPYFFGNKPPRTFTWCFTALDRKYKWFRLNLWLKQQKCLRSFRNLNISFNIFSKSRFAADFLSPLGVDRCAETISCSAGEIKIDGIFIVSRDAGGDGCSLEDFGGIVQVLMTSVKWLL